MELNPETNVLTPTNPDNYIVDYRSEYKQDGKIYYSQIVKGIKLAPSELIDDAWKDHYEEVTDEWKREHEPQPEPEPETEDQN